MRRETGQQFDPEVVAAFLRIPPVEWEELRARVARARRRTEERRAPAVAASKGAAHRSLLEAALLLPV